VGNGSVPVFGFRKPLLPVVGRGARVQATDTETSCAARKPFMNPFVIFTYPDVVVVLTFTGIIYAVNYTITASISSSFAVTFPYLSETAIGLCYLSSGGGMIIGSTFTGRFLDWEYLRIEKREESSEHFPFEYARLRTMPLHLLIFFACVSAWGWVLESGVSIAVPLVLQFIRKRP
jgi:predicted MFS family arabinose efflux permease